MRTSSVQTPVNVFDWLSNHAHLVGWLSIVTLCIKAIRFLTRLGDRFERAEETLQTVANNHLAHIETSIGSMDSNLHGMREDMKGLRDDIKDFSLALLGRK